MALFYARDVSRFLLSKEPRFITSILYQYHHTSSVIPVIETATTQKSQKSVDTFNSLFPPSEKSALKNCVPNILCTDRVLAICVAMAIELRVY